MSSRSAKFISHANFFCGLYWLESNIFCHHVLTMWEQHHLPSCFECMWLCECEMCRTKIDLRDMMIGFELILIFKSLVNFQNLRLIYSFIRGYLLFWSREFFALACIVILAPEIKIKLRKFFLVWNQCWFTFDANCLSVFLQATIPGFVSLLLTTVFLNFKSD